MSGITNNKQTEYSQSIKAALEGMTEEDLKVRLPLCNETELKTIQRALGEGDGKPLDQNVTNRVCDLLFFGKPVAKTPAAKNLDASWVLHVKPKQVYDQIIRNKKATAKNPFPAGPSASHDSSAEAATIKGRIDAFKSTKEDCERRKAEVEATLKSKEETLASLKKDQEEIEKITRLEQGNKLLKDLKAYLTSKDKEAALRDFSRTYQGYYTNPVFQDEYLKKKLVAIGVFQFPNLVHGKKIINAHAEIKKQIGSLAKQIKEEKNKDKKAPLIEALGVLQQLNNKCSELNRLFPDQVGPLSTKELWTSYKECIKDKKCFEDSTKLNKKILEIGTIIKPSDIETKTYETKKKVKKLDEALQEKIEKLDKLITEKRQACTNHTVTQTYEKLLKEKERFEEDIERIDTKIKTCDDQIDALERNLVNLKRRENQSPETKQQIEILNTSLDVYNKLERVLSEKPKEFEKIVGAYWATPRYMHDDYKSLWDGLTQLLNDKNLDQKGFIASEKQRLTRELKGLRGEVQEPSLIEALAQQSVPKTLSEVRSELNFYRHVNTFYQSILLNQNTWNGDQGSQSVITDKIGEIKQLVATSDLSEQERPHYLTFLKQLTFLRGQGSNQLGKAEVRELNQETIKRITVLVGREAQLTSTLSEEETDTDLALDAFNASDSGDEIDAPSSYNKAAGVYDYVDPTPGKKGKSKVIEGGPQGRNLVRGFRLKKTGQRIMNKTEDTDT